MSIEDFLSQWKDDSPTLLVHTSGSTGKPKPMLVEKRRMMASARTTCRFLGLKEGDTALLCMSLDYIAGKMMVVRALCCGLKLVVTEPCGLPSWDGHIDFAAMVPLQVWNLLHDATGRQRLADIQQLIIGGGAINEKLASALADMPHPIWSTYGMTETLSHIALRQINGPEASEWYTPLPGVSLSLSNEGCLIVDAPEVHSGKLITNDLAELHDDGTFRILGRRDNVVCSGGLKIQIEEVEQLLSSHLSVPFIISKAPDSRLGEQMVLLTETTDDITAIETVCRQQLPRYWQPRHIISISHLPLTETGKPARKEAERIATDYCQHKA